MEFGLASEAMFAVQGQFARIRARMCASFTISTVTDTRQLRSRDRPGFDPMHGQGRSVPSPWRGFLKRLCVSEDE